MNQYGIIYVGTSPSGNKYIGQHKSNVLVERLQSHMYRYETFLKKKCILELNKKFQPNKTFPANPSGFCTALYCAFQKYGIKQFKWEVLKDNIPLNQLNTVEDQYINEYDTLAPNGYNLKINKSDGTRSIYSDETLLKMSVSHTKSRKEHLHKYRKHHDELVDVPQFVTHFESGGIRGYRILNHPKCSFKQFADSSTPILELKANMLKFLELCNDKPYETSQKRKQREGIPKGISEQKPGRFLVQFSLYGIKYNKYFSQSPREEALRLATEWMQNKKDQIKVERSETK